MADFYPATPELTERISRLINAYHPHLRAARLKVEWRDKTRTLQHAASWAEVDTPNNDAQAREYDFYLWFALDAWAELDETQRDALTDHELCHCGWDDKGKPFLLGHDIQEFNAVLARWGAWWPDNGDFVSAVKQGLAQTPNPTAMAPAGQEGIDNMSLGYGGYQRPMQGNGGTKGGSFQTPMPGNGGTKGGSYGDPQLSPEDALIDKLRQLRAKLRDGGFSEVETGRLSDTFLRHWANAVTEGYTSRDG